MVVTCGASQQPARFLCRRGFRSPAIDNDAAAPVAPVDAEAAAGTAMQLVAPQCRRIEFWDEPPNERPDNAVILRVQGRRQGVLQTARDHAAHFVLQTVDLPCVTRMPARTLAASASS